MREYVSASKLATKPLLSSNYVRAWCRHEGKHAQTMRLCSTWRAVSEWGMTFSAATSKQGGIICSSRSILQPLHSALILKASSARSMRGSRNISYRITMGRGVYAGSIPKPAESSFIPNCCIATISQPFPLTLPQPKLYASSGIERRIDIHWYSALPKMGTTVTANTVNWHLYANARPIRWQRSVKVSRHPVTSEMETGFAFRHEREQRALLQGSIRVLPMM